MGEERLTADERRALVTERHAYVPQGVPTWRTCKLCGRGANAAIHRAERCAVCGGLNPGDSSHVRCM